MPRIFLALAAFLMVCSHVIAWQKIALAQRDWLADRPAIDTRID